MSKYADTKITYICDVCGRRQDKPFKNDGRINFEHAVQDWQGANVAGRQIKGDLCDPCVTAFAQLIARLILEQNRESKGIDVT